jgi:Resolvase, N terminal domain
MNSGELTMPRSIKLKQTPTHWLYSLDQFPKGRDGILYVRQSSDYQKEHRVHSFEMQTDTFLKYFRDMGCTGKITIIADDEKGKMSGTLDIHERPGLTRVVEAVEAGKVGWVGAVHVNRLTRDPWLITPAVLMKTFHEHKVWIATLRMHFNFDDDYCQRVFMLEAEESARHLKWMKLILGGAKLVASGKGYYDGRYLAPGYIVDRTDPKRMKYMAYHSHADISLRLFQRLLELDGNFPLLRREIDRMPYLYPPFEEWVDPKNVSKFVIKQIEDGPYRGCYKPTGDGLRSIMTNPVFTGLWIPFEGEPIKNNHEAIVPDDLFWYAFNRLSRVNLLGERMKPIRVSRTTQAEALLIKCIKDEEDYPLYVETNRHGNLIYKKLYREWMGYKHGFSVECATLDTMFLEKLFSRIESLVSMGIAWEDAIEKKQADREQHEHHIKKSLLEAERKMKRLMSLMSDPDNPLPRSMKQEYIEQYNGLEIRKAELEAELLPDTLSEETEEQALFHINQLIPRIRNEWDTLTFSTRLLIVSGLVRRVVMTRPASGWLKMHIVWKLPDWGIDEGHIRKTSSKSPWTPEEDAILRRLYPQGEVMAMLEAMPIRNWAGIQERGAEIGIRRTLDRSSCMASVQASGIPIKISLEDWQYAQEHGLSASGKNPQWIG